MKRRGTSGADELSGTGRADTIRGLGGDDIIHGGGGLDTIYGGAGDDTINVTFGGKLFSGDAGNDLFKVVGLSFGGSTVAVDGGAGTDTFDASSVAGGSDYLYFTDNGTDQSIAVGDYVVAGVEVIHGGFGRNYFNLQNQTTGVTVYGGEQDDIFVPSYNPEDVPGYTGNNVMYGLGGNDAFTMRYGAEAYGGAGDDRFEFYFNARTTVDGGSGVDTASLPYGGNVDLSLGILSLAFGSVSYVSNVENVTVSTTSFAQTLNVFGDDVDNVLTLVSNGSTQGVNLDGRGGDDAIYAALGGDIIFGGTGDDTIYGFGGDDRIEGGAGFDVILGGDGSDTASYADQTGNVSIRLAEAGFSVAKIDGTLEDQLLSIENLVGGVGKDSLTGNGVANTLVGGDGADILAGSAGQDTLTGGTRADHFVFSDGDGLSPDRAIADVITDFNHGQRDQIDLAAIDADTANSGDQAFRFIGTGAFSGRAGELRFEVTDGSAFVSGDTNGDGVGDFTIKLDNVIVLETSDFRL